MRVLLDHCVDVRFSQLLPGHEVSNTKELGWEKLSNGKLLSAAKEADFEAFLTVDKNLRFQQNLAKIGLPVITINTRFTTLEDIAPFSGEVLKLLDQESLEGMNFVVGE
ncbi:MAG TPA: hypothetical protein VGL56_13810 [Fimbriimonadaceae bacterium]|jgi:hypothetical protein